MSAFKDAVADDVKGVFLNADEFSDYHDIDGERVLCQIDSDVTGPAKADLEGVFVNTVVVYVASLDLVRRPVEGQPISIDGRLFFVANVSDEQGILAITCGANDQ